MMIWVLSVIVALAATLWIARPLVASRPDLSGETDWSHDIAVYRHQLSELDIERERGLIGEEEARTARAEIARRLLKAEEARSLHEGASTWAKGRPVAAIAILAVPALALGAYAVTGSPQLPAQPLAARVQEQQMLRAAADERAANLERMVAQVEAHLANDPGDGQGWNVLAPVYLRMGRPEQSVEAYKRANALLGPAPERFAGLGEALFAQAEGVLTEDARSAFRSALELQPVNARARFYLAFAEAQDGAFDAARDSWEELAADDSADEQWRMAAREGLQRLESDAAGLRPVTVPDNARASAAPQIDDETRNAAAAMGEEDRRAMILSMVEGLDQRLAEEPGDTEGWMRLIRSRMALGDFEAASDALQRSQTALAGEPEKALRIVRFADELGVTAPKAGASEGGESQ